MHKLSYKQLSSAILFILCSLVLQGQQFKEPKRLIPEVAFRSTIEKQDLNNDGIDEFIKSGDIKNGLIGRPTSTGDAEYIDPLAQLRLPPTNILYEFVDFNNDTYPDIWLGNVQSPFYYEYIPSNDIYCGPVDIEVDFEQLGNLNIEEWIYGHFNSDGIMDVALVDRNEIFVF